MPVDCVDGPHQYHPESCPRSTKAGLCSLDSCARIYHGCNYVPEDGRSGLVHLPTNHLPRILLNNIKLLKFQKYSFKTDIA